MDQASSLSPFWPLFESTSTITIVPDKRTLIAFLSVQPIQQVITALSQHHILSAPVVSDTEHTILGSVDVLQIADYLSLHGLGEEKQPIIKVIEHARNSGYEAMTPFYSTNPLSLLVDLFATGIHRVALFKESCELVTPVSQSDVIVWLSKNLDKSDAITTYVNESIDKLFGARNVKPVSVSQDTSVRDTIKSMRSAGVSSVAIIDDSNRLVGAFAPSDLRGLVDLNTLSQPVINYLKAHAQTPIIVKPDTTLAQIITTLATKRQHRVWVVDDRVHPVSIISTTDIMRVIGSGAPVTARQANADIDASKLWIAKPFTLQVTMNMISDDASSSTIQVSASTQTKIGWSKMT